MAYQYDVVVIGGGAAGLTSAGLSASFGAKTLLVESKRLGGDCTWCGCIPSKTLITSARVAHYMRNGKKYGLDVHEPASDLSAVFGRVRSIRQKIYEEADEPRIYEKMGIDVHFGKARFTDRNTIVIDNGKGLSTVTSRYFVIATGSRPAVPQINGLHDVDYFTNESIFELDKIPPSLVVIGGGPAGLEMAQSFARLGSRVTVIDKMNRILSADDAQYAAILKEELEKEGIHFLLDTAVRSIRKKGKVVRVEANKDGSPVSAEGAALLIATGRTPNLESLDLGAAGVEHNAGGIIVNRRCRTNKKNIYACGDVTGRYQFTHMADHMAKVAVSNMLLKYPVKLDEKSVIWCTYTEPEVAHVGMRQQELDEKSVKYHIYRFPYKKIDRAVVEEETTGWIKVYARPWNGRILGATIIGKNAGEMICEFALAIKNGVTLRAMADTIHPYPTYGLGNRRVADQWYVQHQSRGLVRLLRLLFGYRGDLPDVSDKDRIA